MDVNGYTNDWLKLMAERISRWEGYTCQILSEDSIKCEHLNNYISKHWVNLDIKTGVNHLLIFAVGKPTDSWLARDIKRYEALNSKAQYRLREMIRFYKSDSDREEIMARVHKFKKSIETMLNNRVNLPAITFPQIEKTLEKEHELRYEVFDLVDCSSEILVEETLFNIMEIANQSWKKKNPYEMFIESIKENSDNLKFIGGLNSTLPIMEVSLPILYS